MKKSIFILPIITLYFPLILVICIALLPVHTKAGVRLNPEYYSTKDLDYCNADELLPNLRPLHGPKPLGLCYTVKSGDTLWSIAQRYYGSGFKWNQLIEVYNSSHWHDGLPWPIEGWNYYSRITDPRQLAVGIKVRITIEESILNSSTSETYHTWSDSPGTSIFIGKKQDKRYDGPFGWLYEFLIDRKTNNLIYIVGARENGWGGDLQLIVNKERNPYIGPGANFDLFTFSPNGKNYATRTNIRQNDPNPGFIILSNINNGPEYDYSDSLIWYDDDTLIYRAQNNDQWRVVVNHKDYKVFNYLENLRVENGVVKFDARHDDGSWTKEELILK